MILPLLFGCGAPDALPGSMVILSDDVDAAWSDALYEEDGDGELYAVEALVLGPDGRPAPGVRATVTLGWDGATVHPGDVNATSGGPRVHLHSDEREVQLAPCAASGPDDGWCTFLEVLTGPDGRAEILVFVDVAPDSGASIPVFVTAGDDVQSVEIGFGDPPVVH